MTYRLGSPLQAVSKWEPDTPRSAFLAMQKDSRLSISLFTFTPLPTPSLNPFQTGFKLDWRERGVLDGPGEGYAEVTDAVKEESRHITLC